MSKAAYRTKKMRIGLGNEEATGDLDKSNFQQAVEKKTSFVWFQERMEEEIQIVSINRILKIFD